MHLLIMADIHGNLEALKQMLEEVKRYPVQGCVLLGDLIDYGMHSNEVIEMLQTLNYPVLCNLQGNHEQAILHESYESFSTMRGRESAGYTRGQLNENTWQYIRELEDSGKQEFWCDGKRCLAVHGSLEDTFWRSISPEQALDRYSAYDYVFSGHSHRPHFFEKYYAAADERRRNQKKTVFINPGSVGQPRNLNPGAQAVLLDTETGSIRFLSVVYDIAREQRAFGGQVDPFYSERLENGV